MADSNIESVYVTVEATTDVTFPPDSDIAGATIGLTWIEWALEEPDETTTIYVWSKVDLPDPADYFQGFKEARVLSWGDINRSLSDDRGQYEGADFNAVVADIDNLLRGLMDGLTTRYGFYNRNVVIRMIRDDQRRLLMRPRVIARGILKAPGPEPPAKLRLDAQDHVTSKFAGTNTSKQIPQRVLGPTFVGAPLETRKLAAPIVYGRVSDEASDSAPPVLDGDPARGAFLDGGVFWVAGFGNLTSSAAPPTAPMLADDGPGSGTLPAATYGIVVTAIDSLGRETDSVPFYTDASGFVSSFPPGIQPQATSDGTMSVTANWTGSVGAVKYRCYLGQYYYGFRPQQYIEVNDPVTTCTFTTGPAGPDSNPTLLTPGANLVTFAQFWWYVVMARMSDGLTGVSQTLFGITRGIPRPLRVQWLPVVGATEYIVARRGTGDFDRQWVVSAMDTFFDDDLIDTGVTYLDGGLVQPRGAHKLMYVGDKIDDSGTAAGTWSMFLVGGHAVGKVTPFLNGVRVHPGCYGVTWLVPGNPGALAYTDYFSAASPQGRYFDFGDERFSIVMVRGPDAEAAKNGECSANVEGIDVDGDGTGPMIEGIFQQYKHFVINWGFQNYKQGAYLTAPTWAPDAPEVSQVDEDSFDVCEDIGAYMVPGGYLGAGVVGSGGVQETLRDWMARWNLSAGVDSGFNRNSQFFISMLDDRPELLDAALELTQQQDIIKDSFSIAVQTDRFFNILPYSYRRRYRDDTWEVENEEARDDLSIDGYREEKTAPVREFWFVRDLLTAENVMNRALMLSKDPPMLAVFTTPLVGLNTELGDIVRVTHRDGLGPNGYVRRALRILRHAINPNNFTVRMECQDIERAFQDSFILGDRDALAADWLTADEADRAYGYLCDRDTGQFSNGDAGKRLRYSSS